MFRGIRRFIDRKVRKMAEKPSYEILGGTEYSRYALPVEYMPSRDWKPRWGYGRPLEPTLEKWFSSKVDAYQSFVNQMRRDARKLTDIPLKFEEGNLPLPAWKGVPYSPFDAVALYSMIHQAKPKTYLEIGSGITTCFARRAISDAKLSTKIVSIDPQPRASIDSICDEVLREGLETCDVSMFQSLEAGDILFFDGSHRSFMNSDVTVFMIDILPYLKPGVIIHIHDITLPWDYPESFRDWHWNEQYLLAVYLMASRQRVEPLLPTAFICRHPLMALAVKEPLLDFGPDNELWTGGGAMWFTHMSES